MRQLHGIGHYDSGKGENTRTWDESSEGPIALYWLSFRNCGLSRPPIEDGGLVLESVVVASTDKDPVVTHGCTVDQDTRERGVRPLSKRPVGKYQKRLAVTIYSRGVLISLLSVLI